MNLMSVLRAVRSLSSAARAVSVANGTGRAAFVAPRAGAARFQSTTTVDNHASPDHYFESEKIDKAGDPSRRTFTYFMLGGARFLYASAARLCVIRFVGSMSASADVLALASAEFELGAIESGSTITVKWRGKPVFIRRRTDAEMAEANKVNIGDLRDPEKDDERVQKPEWLVVLGICTHLGCVPISNAGDYGGWYCPCHGSHYDVSGRIRKGPAPLNLEVPPYEFLEEEKIKIG